MSNFRISNNTKGQLLFFLLWPFGSLVYSARYFSKPFSKNIIWLFAAFYGFTIVVTAQGYDAYRYIQEFQKFASDNSLIQETFNNYFKSPESLDLYKSFLMWLVSRFTDDYRIFYASTGLIFGFFYSRNIWFVLDRLSTRINLVLLLFILSFAFITPIFALQFIRFGTATQIFLYGTLLFLGKSKNSGFWWAASSILVHFSFILPVTLLLLYKLIPKRLNVFFAFFIIATFILEVDLRAVREFLTNYLPEVFQPKVESYTNIRYAESVDNAFQATNWYIQYRAMLFRYLSYGLILLIYIKGKKLLEEHADYLNLFCFVLLMYGVANILSIVPSGSRFVTPSLVLLFVVVIKYLDDPQVPLSVRIVKIASIPILLLYIIVGIRYGIDTMGLMFFLGNPVLALIVQDNTPVIDYIKAFL